MPQVANQNWYNAHNFYGDLATSTPRRSRKRARSSTRTTRRTTRCWSSRATSNRPRRAPGSSKYFAPLAARAQPPRPDISEPARNWPSKRKSYVDRARAAPGARGRLAGTERGTPDQYAFGLLDQILLQGEDSALWQKLVQERGYAGGVGGGINLLGNMFNYDGPMLWTLYLIHDPAVAPDTILADIDAEIARLKERRRRRRNSTARSRRSAPISTISRAPATHFGLVDLLAPASRSLTTTRRDQPHRIGIPRDHAGDDPDVARRYLHWRRTVQIVDPAARRAGAAP